MFRLMQSDMKIHKKKKTFLVSKKVHSAIVCVRLNIENVSATWPISSILLSEDLSQWK